MASLKQIKGKIRSVGKTRQVTRAMEAVSAAKMRKAQGRALAARAYARAAAEVLARASGARELANHPLTRGAEKERSQTSQSEGKTWPSGPERPSEGGLAKLYIVITSDKGLAGALNSGVLRAVHAETANSKASIIAIGRKANDFFAKRGFKVEAFHLNTDDITAEIIHDIVEEAASRFVLGAVSSVKIAYQNFISTFEQRPAIREIFPLSLVELEKIVAGIAPAKGAFSGLRTRTSDVRSYSVEPGEREVLDAILPKLAGIFVYHALLESQASEHSARMVAMKSASDKAQEMTHSLTLQFNKARQSAITREVSEIIGGIV